MSPVVAEPVIRLKTDDDVQVAIKRLFKVDRLTTFLKVGNVECGRCYWFRLPASKGSKLARIDEQGCMHLYNLNLSMLLTRHGEIWP